jgi:drug/metabolite transporter (DMT)-like permease
MFYLIAGIIANVLIFLSFRTFSIYRIDNIQAIVVNYVVCVLLGLLVLGDISALQSIELSSAWSWMATFIGLLLVMGFYAATQTAQKMGVSITSVASKVSMVFPILFSLFILKIDSKQFSVFNYLGMFLAVFSIYLGSLRKGNPESLHLSTLAMFMLPLAVFVIGGLIDISLNFSNYKLLNEENQTVFPIVLFGSAAVIGAVFALFQKKRFEVKSLVGGFYLGVSNYLSLYFVLKALTVFENNGAVFYPIYNVGIILLSSFLAMLFFKERLSGTNFLGLGLSILALFLLSYQEILAYF